MLQGHVDIIERDVKCIGIDYKDNMDCDDSKESDVSTNDDLSNNIFESANEYEKQQVIVKQRKIYIYINLRKNVKIQKMQHSKFRENLHVTGKVL